MTHIVPAARHDEAAGSAHVTAPHSSDFDGARPPVALVLLAIVSSRVRPERALASLLMQPSGQRSPDNSQKFTHAQAVARHPKEFWARLCDEVERGSTVGTMAQRYGVMASTVRSAHPSFVALSLSRSHSPCTRARSVVRADEDGYSGATIERPGLEHAHSERDRSGGEEGPARVHHRRGARRG